MCCAMPISKKRGKSVVSSIIGYFSSIFQNSFQSAYQGITNWLTGSSSGDAFCPELAFFRLKDREGETVLYLKALSDVCKRNTENFVQDTRKKEEQRQEEIAKKTKIKKMVKDKLYPKWDNSLDRLESIKHEIEEAKKHGDNATSFTET